MNKRELDWIFFISSRTTKIFLFDQKSIISLLFCSRPVKVKNAGLKKQGKPPLPEETKPAIRVFLVSLSLHLNARVLLYNTHKQVSRKQKIMAFVAGGISTLRISAANHVRPKGAKESRKNRPVKHRPSDKNRAPTNYPTVDPAAVPPVYTIVSEAPKKTD